MKKIVLLILCLTFIASIDYADAEKIKFSWYIAGESIQAIDPLNPDALPDSLIISPGIYTYKGQAYNMTREGLYRYTEIRGISRQYIVYKNDKDKLLSSIAWVTTHGNSDDRLTTDQLKVQAKTRKININCGKIVELVKSVLPDAETRQISAFALDGINNIFDGHVMLEVWHSELNKWVLYDLDNNCVFTDTNNNLLSLWEVLEVVNKGDYILKPIANDINFDIANYKFENYDGGIQWEMIIAEKYKFLKRVLVFPTIYENGIYYSVKSTRTRDLTGADAKYLTGLGIKYKVLTETEFLKKFYNQ